MRILPIRDARRKVWTWTDGVVTYEARTRSALLAEIRDGEGHPVDLVQQDCGAYWQHPLREAVIDLWSFGNTAGQIVGHLNLLSPITAYDVYQILARARIRGDARAASRERPARGRGAAIELSRALL